ncbi:hypothetical protein F2P81_007467 [Scophthalmus maximus]|uniref:CCHC-type domain-containing protein n=1 Tax=Scophthalmus maximus TaxID=52904 RepID=A0A6A4TAP0_SCOMX|nr:hypothetical protein F2P81_007467 [Scophthalmus maximus]
MKHVVSHRRHLYMMHDTEGYEKLNLCFRIKVDDYEYVTFGKFFGCGEEGHTVKSCPRRSDPAPPGCGGSTNTRAAGDRCPAGCSGRLLWRLRAPRLGRLWPHRSPHVSGRLLLRGQHRGDPLLGPTQCTGGRVILAVLGSVGTMALVGLLNQTGGVSGPGEVLCDVGPQELEAGDTFNSHPVDVNGIVRASSFSPEVHDELLRLAGVEEQVIVSTPSGQMLYLLPVGCLVVVADEANHRRIVRKLDDGVGSMYRSAVVGEEGVEEWAQHTALWAERDFFVAVTNKMMSNGQHYPPEPDSAGPIIKASVSPKMRMEKVRSHVHDVKVSTKLSDHCEVLRGSIT